MKKWVGLLNPAALVTGGVLGIIALHPVVMCYADMRKNRDLDHAIDAVFQAFRSQMFPMIGACAALGAAFALCCLAVEGLFARRAATQRTKPGASLVRVCMYCKSIPQHDPHGKDRWIPLEQALLQSRGIEFTHGVCPRCHAAHLEPEIRALRGTKSREQGDVAAHSDIRRGSQQAGFG
jgi:hypothetical protein